MSNKEQPARNASSIARAGGKYTLHVSGTHCASCKILLEDIFKEQEFIKDAFVNLKKEIVEIEVQGEKNLEEIIETLNSKIKDSGYTLSQEKLTKEKEKNLLWMAIPLGLLFLGLFFLLQKSGILNFGLGSETTPITSLLIGVIASLSSCLAIVGGLILSLSAKVSQDEGVKSSRRSIILFHSGRLVGFAILGGILGFIGQAIGINFVFSAILGLIASAVMIMLGLNLIGVFKKNKITLPSSIFSFFRKAEHAVWAPLLIGVGTFFLPCGFTQSMQIAALSSGGFTSGLFIMLSFALGTLPVLAILSFGSVSFAQSKYAPLFFKTAGVVVLGLGAFAFLSGLAGVGIINPLFNI